MDRTVDYIHTHLPAKALSLALPCVRWRASTLLAVQIFPHPARVPKCIDGTGPYHQVPFCTKPVPSGTESYHQVPSPYHQAPGPYHYICQGPHTNPDSGPPVRSHGAMLHYKYQRRIISVNTFPTALFGLPPSFSPWATHVLISNLFSCPPSSPNACACQARTWPRQN